MKRYMSGVISLVTLFSVLCMLTGCGATGSKGIEFKSNGDGTCAVVGIGNCEDNEIVIPNKSPEGDSVTEIADEAFKNTEITSVEMPNSITKIGTEAFWNCKALKDIKFSNSLKIIGSKAFSNCVNIEELCLPDSLEEFERTVDTNGEEYEGSSTFIGCEKLKKINIPKKLKAVYSDTFQDTALAEIEIAADFKYGHFDVQFMSELGYYLPALYAEDPEIDDDDIIKITEGIKTILYSEIFYNEAIIINGEEVSIAQPLCTSGFYGSKNENDAFNIKDNSIEEMSYNKISESYDVKTSYSDDRELIFNFEFDDDYGAYVYENSHNEEVKFVVYDNFLFTDGGYAQCYELNVKYNN